MWANMMRTTKCTRRACSDSYQIDLWDPLKYSIAYINSSWGRGHSWKTDTSIGCLYPDFRTLAQIVQPSVIVQDVLLIKIQLEIKVLSLSLQISKVSPRSAKGGSLTPFRCQLWLLFTSPFLICSRTRCCCTSRAAFTR